MSILFWRNGGPQPPSIAIVRVATAILLWLHGAHRLFTGGYAGFGNYLDGQGIPFGHALALAITLFEVTGPLLLVLRRAVVPVALGHALILVSGILMVHGSEGWWVVGAGRNGVEFSVLLLAALAATIQAELEARAGDRSRR
ncbi:MAG: DoxX family protein [Thermoanaerobaculia bacterium]